MRTSETSNMLTYVSVLILVGTEIYGVALALAWALGGFFELGDTITYALYAIAAALASYVMFIFARKAYGIDSRLDDQAERKGQSHPI